MNSCQIRVLFLSKRLGTLSILVALVGLLLPSFLNWVAADEPPVWKFDFRDVFYDIAFPDGKNGVIVGAHGRVLISHDRYRNLWSPRDSGTRKLLTCLSFVDERNGWAAGHGGVIVHTEDGGKTWEVQRKPSRENQPLFDIQFVSRDVGYTCGSYDTFLKTTDGGKTWKKLPTGLDNIYNGLVFLDEDNGFLVGEFGTVLRTRDGGLSWEQLDLGQDEVSFFGLVLLTPQKILVHGISGKIMRSEDGGRTWEDVSVKDCDQSLFRSAAQGDEVVIVGRSGTLFTSTDGGKTFLRRIDEDLTSFAGVCPHPEGGFVCVGERGKIFRIPSSLKKHDEDAS